MASSNRVSLYLTDDEREALRGASQRLGASENYVMRLGLRYLVGLPLSDLNRAEIAHAIHTQVHTSTS